MPLAYPKPLTRRTLKARKKRAEAAVIAKVRAVVKERDGFCRVMGYGLLDCWGASDWAHLEEHRRARTRGQAPERRHTQAGSLMLCTRHHRMYDAHALRLEFLSDRGADGPVQWYAEGFVYTEADV